PVEEALPGGDEDDREGRVEQAPEPDLVSEDAVRDVGDAGAVGQEIDRPENVEPGGDEHHHGRVGEPAVSLLHACLSSSTTRTCTPPEHAPGIGRTPGPAARAIHPERVMTTGIRTGLLGSALRACNVTPGTQPAPPSAARRRGWK